MPKGVGTFQSGSGKSIITDGENEVLLKSDGSVKIIESDTSTEPGSEVRLKFNAQNELIYIEKVVGATLMRKQVTDTSYTGGTTLADVTRTTTFKKFQVI